MVNDKTILVWRFEDAPQELQGLSEHGGDEDWIALVPLSFYNAEGYAYIPWLESPSSFGVCEISQHKTDKGMVFIGAHA